MIKLAGKGKPFVYGEIYFPDNSGLESKCPKCGEYAVVTEIKDSQYTASNKPFPVEFFCHTGLHTDYLPEENVCCDTAWTEWVTISISLKITPKEPEEKKTKEKKTKAKEKIKEEKKI